MDIQKYLDRIQYKGSLVPNLENLQALQAAHVNHVPFENLDIHNSRPIVLELDHLYHKVVEEHRGGFCFELNGLFSELLKEIGFSLKKIAAQIYSDTKQAYGLPFDHMAIIATIDGKEYLTDVGFGEFCEKPLRFELDIAQGDAWGIYRIRAAEQAPFFKIDKQKEGQWIPSSRFDLEPRVLSDYAHMCHYHQTHPDSHFTKNRLCTLPTPNGRITFSGDKLKIKEGDQVTEINVNNPEEERDLLWKHFKIKL